MNPLLSILLKLAVIALISVWFIVKGTRMWREANVEVDWEPDLRNGVLRWINGKTAEILTPEEYAARYPAALQFVKRGGG